MVERGAREKKGTAGGEIMVSLDSFIPMIN